MSKRKSDVVRDVVGDIKETTSRYFSPIRAIGKSIHDAVDEFKGCVLVVDAVGFSRLAPMANQSAAELLDERARTVFREADAVFYSIIGDSGTAVFRRADEAIESAFGLQKLMQAEGFELRAAVAYGSLTKTYRRLSRHYDFDGDARVVAARLLALARPGEVIADTSIAESGLVDPDRYRTAATQRKLGKAFIDHRPGASERFHESGEILLLYSLSRNDAHPTNTATAKPGVGAKGYGRA